jgi:hypothetical protein
MKHPTKATYETIECISYNILSQSESFLWQVATIAFLGLPAVDPTAIGTEDRKNDVVDNLSRYGG